MKTILVPTDFSTCANNAVDFAIQSSKILPVEVTIVHAFDLVGNIYTDYMGVNKEFNQSLLHEVRIKLADLEKCIRESEGVKVDTRVSTASLRESIFQVTNEKAIDIIVMGTTGSNGIKEKLWGSKTADIIGRSKVPVLAIPFEWMIQHLTTLNMHAIFRPMKNYCGKITIPQRLLLRIFLVKILKKPCRNI
jgi:nucleotide-binding universal stress UspA family protein